MIVCVCNQISDREIERQVQAGMDFSDIQLELGVGTCCGCCEDCARTLVEECCKGACASPQSAAAASVASSAALRALAPV